jgi:hypothetical protein
MKHAARPTRLDGRTSSIGQTKPERNRLDRMNVWIRKVHMYLGLVNFTLLILFGLAGLAVTAEAPDIFHQEGGPAVASREFTAPPGASDREVARLLAPLMAPPHSGPPVVRRNAANHLVTDFYSVNGLTRVTLIEHEHRAQVQTYRNSIWRFLDNAHATTLGERSQSAAVHVWAWYIELSIWSLAAMALTGAWLGVSTRWKFRWTRVSLAAGCAAFVLLYWLER